MAMKMKTDPADQSNGIFVITNDIIYALPTKKKSVISLFEDLIFGYCDFPSFTLILL